MRSPTAFVVTVQAVPVVLPITTTALNVVLALPLLVRRTAIVLPELSTPVVAHAPPLMLICGLPPPDTDTLMAALHPDGVMVLLVYIVESDALVTLVKLNALGPV